jgi:hypothetical protein
MTNDLQGYLAVASEELTQKGLILALLINKSNAHCPCNRLYMQAMACQQLERKLVP